MPEAAQALGPYPILQLIFGLVVLVLGVISILKGLQGKTPPPDDPEALWASRKQLENIEQNSWKMVALLERQNELLGRLISVLYNERQRY